MIQPRLEEHGESGVYTCMLWNVKTGRPTVVTIYGEHPDRWIGRRCVVATTAFEAPLETFMKSDWRRGEPPSREEARAAAPAPVVPGNVPAGFQGFRP